MYRSGREEDEEEQEQEEEDHERVKREERGWQRGHSNQERLRERLSVCLSKTIKWWTPIRRMTWCEKYNCNRCNHVTEKYSYIRPSEVFYIKKKKNNMQLYWKSLKLNKNLYISLIVFFILQIKGFTNKTGLCMGFVRYPVLVCIILARGII